MREECNRLRYSTKEAAIIATGFSTVSATFMIVVARTLGLLDHWNVYFWSTLIITFIVTALTTRIYPLSKKPDTGYNGMTVVPEPIPEKGKLLFGTVDTWLIWRLTRGDVHVTDVSNASRTMLFNINTLQWDDELLEMFGIPRSMMPEVRSSSEVYGHTKTTIFAHKVPVAGIAGDQQAALFGQMCTEPGMVKNTYGTGCFLLMNSGEKPIMSQNNLITTVAWKIGDKVNYALEGSIFVGGSVVQWLRDGLGVISSSSEVEELASRVPDTNGVYFVPALTGLGAPWWDQYARGTIVGISRGTTTAHIARAALEGIAFQTMDITAAMSRDAGIPLRELKVDGGASRNNLLMQFQADILGTRVIRPQVVETTAMGAAYLAGLAVGYWSGVDEIRKQWHVDRVFEPSWEEGAVCRAKEGWADAVRRTLSDYAKR